MMEDKLQCVWCGVKIKSETEFTSHNGIIFCQTICKNNWLTGIIPPRLNREPRHQKKMNK